MTTKPPQHVDRNGKPVTIGSLVRVIRLSGEWFDNLPPDERSNVESMIGEVFTVEEIDEYGQAWVTKTWPNEVEETFRSHSVALALDEMECIGEIQGANTSS